MQEAAFTIQCMINTRVSIFAMPACNRKEKQCVFITLECKLCSLDPNLSLCGAEGILDLCKTAQILPTVQSTETHIMAFLGTPTQHWLWGENEDLGQEGESREDEFHQ